MNAHPTSCLTGQVGSLIGENALKARVGEKIRLYIGNGGPNLSSSFHVIGEIFDTVYQEGGTVPSQHNVQTTEIPAGGTAMVEFKVEVPGTCVLVDHALFRAFNKGALGMLKVEGPQNTMVYSGKEVDAVYLGKAAAGTETERKITALNAQVKEEISSNPKIAGLTKEIQVQKGKSVYMQTCFVCHQPEGQGVVNQIPPLAKSDFLAAKDRDNIIRGILEGRTGQLTVNGKTYNGTMVPLAYLTDDQIANVLTYVRNSWGNAGDAINAQDVARLRHEVPPLPTKSAFE